MVYDVNNNSKSDHTGELSPFVSESKLTLSFFIQVKTFHQYHDKIEKV